MNGLEVMGGCVGGGVPFFARVGAQLGRRQLRTSFRTAADPHPFLSPPRYGFVTFSDEADAIKAVAALDKSEIAGRQVNVELAKPPTATARAPRETTQVAADGTVEAGVDGAAPRARKPRAKVSPRVLVAKRDPARAVSRRRVLVTEADFLIPPFLPNSAQRVPASPALTARPRRPATPPPMSRTSPPSSTARPSTAPLALAPPVADVPPSTLTAPPPLPVLPVPPMAPLPASRPRRSSSSPTSPSA